MKLGNADSLQAHAKFHSFYVNKILIKRSHEILK